MVFQVFVRCSCFFFFSSRRRHTRSLCDWSSDVCSSDLSSISLATVTPSLVIVGDPHFLSRTTLRPRGPSVTLTALASVCTPDSTAWRAFSSKMISFAAMLNHSFVGGGLVRSQRSADDGENILLAHDQILVAVDANLGAGVLPHEDLVARLDVERDALSLIGQPPGPHGDDFRLLRLLLGGIRDDDAAALRFGRVEAANEDAIGQRLHVHCGGSSCFRVHAGCDSGPLRDPPADNWAGTRAPGPFYQSELASVVPRLWMRTTRSGIGCGVGVWRFARAPSFGAAEGRLAAGCPNGMRLVDRAL